VKNFKKVIVATLTATMMLSVGLASAAFAAGGIGAGQGKPGDDANAICVLPVRLVVECGVGDPGGPGIGFGG
jgi:hypothetical protein